MISLELHTICIQSALSCKPCSFALIFYITIAISCSYGYALDVLAHDYLQVSPTEY